MDDVSAELNRLFHWGLGKPPRAHQVQSVQKQLRAVDPASDKRFLIQHAPGSGKTEVIALLARELLTRGKADHVVILNYATELEDQMIRRADMFWENIAQRNGPVRFSYRRANSSRDVSKPLAKRSVLFSLLQKFQDDEGEKLKPLETGRVVVIIDEAHRGVPEEGVFIRNVSKRYGEGHVQFFYTATPKTETLQTHGVLRQSVHGNYRVAFDVHTQVDAVAERYVLNPLEKYMNCATCLKADGQRLINADLAGSVPMKTFIDRLHKQKARELLTQQASFVVEHLHEVCKDMPMMTSQGHQIKHLVVAETQQAVYDLGVEIKRLAAARSLSGSTGKSLRVGVFFSGMVRGSGRAAGKNVRDHDVNGASDEKMLETSDVIICCRKFLAGWDEWRVCSVFLCRRIASEEFLQQLLSRATRNRPGSGKKRPPIFDLANHPDDVCAAVARFWRETRQYEGSSGEVNEMAVWIKELSRPCTDAAFAAADVVARLTGRDQILLRAAIVRYYRAAANVTTDLPLSFDRMGEILRELNLALKAQLFGGSDQIAKCAAEELCSLHRSNSGCGSSPSNCGGTYAKTVPIALRRLRTTLELGRRKRMRTDHPLVTPVKKRKGTGSLEEELSKPEDQAATGQDPENDQDELGGPISPVKCQAQSSASAQVAQIKDGLRDAVESVAERFWNSLPDEGDADTPDTRESEVNRFEWAAFPLRRFDYNAVISAQKSLRSKLSEKLGDVMKARWQRERVAAEENFKKELVALRNSCGGETFTIRASELYGRATSEYNEIVDEVGGRVAGAAKRELRKRLKQVLSAHGLNNLQGRFDESIASNGSQA
eukprot:TRINITY_DN14276_c0_g1_i1.p1 TRINITY_DN14276_c0_g1~~TRINITY_DN14276_c0_g1_i1.p1  ORF type:complete len:841 (+),score=119.18 TRINITY_DN14276_c0_g1_i1:38-2524(+)